MSDKLIYDDFFGASVEEGIAKVTAKFKLLEEQNKQNVLALKDFLSGLKVTSFPDLQKLIETFQKLEKGLNDYNTAGKAAAAGEKELEKLEQERLKTLQQKEKLLQSQLRTEQAVNKEAEKSAKAKAKETAEIEKQNRAYVQLSKQLNTMRDRYKDLAAAEQGSSKEARALLVDIQKLDTKLKGIDGSVGQFQRNVGNYASALDNFRASVTNILGAAGISLGASAGFDFLKDSIAEFTKSEKVVKDLGFALKTLSGEGAPALERLNAQAENLEATFGLFESEDISILQKQLVQLGLNSKDVEKLTPKIIDLAAATGKSLPEATDLAIKAINGQTKGLKEVGLEFEDTGKRTDNYNILLGKLDKFQGAASESADTLEGKQQRLAIAFGNVKEAVGEFLIGAGNQLLDVFDNLTGKVTQFDLAIKQLTPSLEKNADFYLKRGKEGIDEYLSILQKQKVEAVTLYKLGEITKEQQKERLDLVAAEEKAIRKRSKAILDEAILKAKEAQGKLNSFRDNNTIETSGANKSEKEKEVFQNGTFDEAILEQDRQLKKDQEELDYEYGKRKKERIAEENKAEYDAAIKLQDELAKADQKRIEDEEKAAEEARVKRIKNTADTAKQIFAIEEKRHNAEQELREKELDTNISNAERNLEFQEKLAINGRENNIAQAEKDLLDAQAAKKQEQEAEIKREQRLAFIKLFAANVEAAALEKKGVAEAFGKTVLEFSLASAYSANLPGFFTGTEKVEDSLKGNKVHNGRDGYVIAVHGPEKVFNEEDSKLIGYDISNHDVAKIVHDYQLGKLLPNEAINFAIPVRSTGESIVNTLHIQKLSDIGDRLQSIEQTIFNKPVSQIHADALGRILDVRFHGMYKEIVTLMGKSKKHNLK